MKLTIANRLPKLPENACYLLFLFDDSKFKGLAKRFDMAHHGLLKRLYKCGDFKATPHETLLLHGLDGVNNNRHLLVGLGDRKKADAGIWRSACVAAAKTLAHTPAQLVLSDCLTNVSIENLQTDDMAEQLIREIGVAAYEFILHRPAHGDGNSNNPVDKSLSRKPFKELILTCDSGFRERTEESGRHGLAAANAMEIARNLGNLAANICTPDYLAEQALSMAAKFDNISSQVLEESDMHELGMGAMLSVSAGSEQAGKLIVMNYQGKKRKGNPVVLIGKGVTFDTGGISMKPAVGMDEMKYDMCGAASVFGVMHALGELQPDINVICLVAAAENMPDGRASRPGDVVTSMSGQTIEILNTDAEGRLVLCDALTYARRFKPVAVVDVATLTGAAVVALGHHMSAVFGNDQNVIDALVSAGDATGDTTWPMPINDQYQSQLDSHFADMANIGGSSAGAITAACFLARFAHDYPWAHLDIAGVAWRSGADKGATGRPVPLLLKYVTQQINS